MKRGSKSVKKGVPSPRLQPGGEDINRLVDYFNRQRDAEGVALAKALLDRFPSFGFGWKVLGAMLKRQGLPEAALAAMVQAAKLMPDDAETHSNLGVMYKAVNRITEAEACYRRALTLSPVAANACNNLGNLLREQGQWQDAEHLLRRALALQPNYADALLNLGFTFYGQERYDEAERCYRQLLALNPGYIKAWYNLGLTLSKQGRHGEAAGCYRKVIEFDPGHFEAFNNLGVALQSTGQLADAMRCFEQATWLNPDFVDAYNNLSVALLNGLDNDHHAEVWRYLEAVVHKMAAQSSWRIATLLLIAYQIGGKFAEAVQLINRFKPDLKAVDEGDRDQRSLRAFFTFLAGVQAYRQNNPTVYQADSPTARLEVVGESHCLSPAHTVFSWRGEVCLALPRFIMGIKMHHLAQPGVHRMKVLMTQHLARVASNSHVLLTIGEIDCRPNEGIWSAAKKDKADLVEVITRTVDGYLAWLQEAFAGRSFASLTLQGVPAPGSSLEGVVPAHEQPVYLAMVRQVNASLKRGTQELGWGFLDVYAATCAANGFGNQQWHLDGIHLTPGFYQVAQHWSPIGQVL